MTTSSESAAETPELVSSPRAKRFASAVLCCYWLTLFISTHIPLPQMERLPKFSDKLMHFGAYGGLAFLLSLWLSSRGPWTKRSALTVVGVVAIYGICDELLQIPVNRTADVADYLADMVGAISGTALFTAVRGQLWRLLGSVLGTKSA